MNIRFDLNDLPIEKNIWNTRQNHIRSVFNDNNKYHLQRFLDECLYKTTENEQ